MKEVKEVTYIKREKAKLDKFVECLNKQDAENSKSYKTKLIYKNYKDGVIFGTDTTLTYLKDNFVYSARRNACDIIESFFDNTYRSIYDYMEAAIIKGSTNHHKKVLKLVNGDKAVFINETLVGDIPKGAKFYILKEKNPVIVLYNNEIIKVVFPILGADGFVEV